MNYQYQNLFVAEWVIVEEHPTTHPSFHRSKVHLDAGRSRPTLGIYETGAPRKAESPCPMPKVDFPPPVSYQGIDQQEVTVVLAEFRDEVYARLAADLAEVGLRVVRAATVDEALGLCEKMEPRVIVANLDLPDQSGWLLAAKLKLIDPEISVCLYQPRSSTDDMGMADFLQVEELLDYEGDMFRLSETIVGVMTDCFFPWIKATAAEGTTQELAVA